MSNYFMGEEKLEIFEYMKYGVKQNLREDYSFYDKYDQIYKKYKRDLNWAIQSCGEKTKDDDYEKAAWLMATILEEPIVADQKINAKIVIDVGLKMISSAENTIYIKERPLEFNLEEFKDTIKNHSFSYNDHIDSIIKFPKDRMEKAGLRHLLCLGILTDAYQNVKSSSIINNANNTKK